MPLYQVRLVFITISIAIPGGAIAAPLALPIAHTVMGGLKVIKGTHDKAKDGTLVTAGGAAGLVAEGLAVGMGVSGAILPNDGLSVAVDGSGIASSPSDGAGNSNLPVGSKTRYTRVKEIGSKCVERAGIATSCVLTIV